MEIKIPEQIKINDRVYEFNDHSKTPGEAKEYIQLIKASMEIEKDLYYSSYLED